jgi:hypothetical protein
VEALLMPLDDDPETFVGPWLALRQAIEARMVASGSWNPGVAPLADEYVAAARWAQELRKAGREEPFSTSPSTGRSFAHPSFAAAGRISRTMRELADTLGLTDPLPDGVAAEDPFAALDELTSRRARRGSANRPEGA